MYPLMLKEHAGGRGRKKAKGRSINFKHTAETRREASMAVEDRIAALEQQYVGGLEYLKDAEEDIRALHQFPASVQFGGGGIPAGDWWKRALAGTSLKPTESLNR
jgi:hypothetical protein